ncbi:MAG: DEAD/DEAH box helicase, partial [Anaerovoracaceae bacterium]|nr:DEAD/DEAH box helicase [Anaerovoracaceae bacterium]
MRYANVIIKNKADSTDSFFTYECDDDSVRAGSVVTVPFGKGNREKEAYVFGFADESEAKKLRALKKISAVDPDVSLTEEIIDTCRWMKKRYMCRYYDALQLFLPAGSKSKRGEAALPYKDEPGEIQDIEELTDEQKRALGEINRAEDSGGGMFLLHGVTGSGKTEVYMRAIEHSLSAGRPAIMLVPEISLTTQIVSRFIGRFGRDSIAVLHSRLTNRERYDEWMRIRRG